MVVWLFGWRCASLAGARPSEAHASQARPQASNFGDYKPLRIIRCVICCRVEWANHPCVRPVCENRMGQSPLCETNEWEGKGTAPLHTAPHHQAKPSQATPRHTTTSKQHRGTSFLPCAPLCCRPIEASKTACRMAATP